MPRRRTATCTPRSTTSPTSSIGRSPSTRKSSRIITRGTWRSASADPRGRAREAAGMRLVIISGLSGSGKTVALHLLEDLGFYCIDNIPVGLLRSFVNDILLDNDGAYRNVGVGLDARNRPSDIEQLPALAKKLRADGVQCEIIFLQASDDVLLSRFSETRRRHPLSNENVSLREAIAKERVLLGPIIDAAEIGRAHV